MTKQNSGMTFHLFLLMVCSFFLQSCSLQYNQTVYAEEYIPEFIFNDVEFTRYENYSRVVQLKAEKLEQYKNTAAAYAQSVNFYTWDSNKLDTEGSCLYLSINSKDQIYSLFTDILIKNYGQDMEIQAQNLRWNGNTEQLTSGIGDLVTVSTQNMTVEGVGFSASGISNTFSFDYDVDGTYDDSSEEQKTEAAE